MSRASYYRLLAADRAPDTAPTLDVPVESSTPCAPVSGPTLLAAPESVQEGVQANQQEPHTQAPETTLKSEVVLKAPRLVARKLSEQAQKEVLELLTSERFVDKSPRAIWAILLEEGRYLCHWRTMYRLLHKLGPVIDRRRQRRHPRHNAPELVASAPNQVWSWDITYLPLTRKQGFAYLYTILDIYSRCVVGWTIHNSECGLVAAELVKESYKRHQIQPGQLVLHADRGSPMKSGSLSELTRTLGVQKSHSRPRVSNDNAFVEAHFKTLKYSARYPRRFENVESARDWARAFVEEYNHEHRHSGLGLLTPAQVHLGRSDELREKRREVLAAAKEANPLRFGRREPAVPGPAAQVRLGPVPNPSPSPSEGSAS